MGKGRRLREKRRNEKRDWVRGPKLPRPPGLDPMIASIIDGFERNKWPASDDIVQVWDHPLPHTAAIGTVYLEEPTDEPGTQFTCLSCHSRWYVEGTVSTGTNKKQTTDFQSINPWGCPLCGYHMLADMYVADIGEGRISATHPDFLPVALQTLLGRIEAGEVTADEALDEIRKAPGLSRIVKWIEAHGATLSLIGLALTLFLQYADPGQESVTPDQVEQIVTNVVDELDRRAQAREQEAEDQAGKLPPVYGPPTPPVRPTPE